MSSKASQELIELYRDFKPCMAGGLKGNLFKFLDEIEDEEDKLVVIKKFINFIVWYKGQVDNGLAHEEMLIAGLYPATRQVKEVSWERITEAINEYEKNMYGEVRNQAEYVPISNAVEEEDEIDDMDEEGGE